MVIDASAYAQNPDGPIKYGNDMIQADPAHNLIFSIHMYAEWKTISNTFHYNLYFLVLFYKLNSLF